MAKALNLKEADRSFASKHLLLKRNLLQIARSIYSYGIFGDLLNMDIEGNPKTYGAFMNAAVTKSNAVCNSLEARQADEDLADMLSMQVGAPILYKERTLFSRRWHTIEVPLLL